MYLSVVSVDQMDKKQILVTFSDGTVAAFTVEDLLAMVRYQKRPDQESRQRKTNLLPFLM